MLTSEFNFLTKMNFTNDYNPLKYYSFDKTF